MITNNDEHKNWTNMCNKIKNILNISDKEFNERKDVTNLCILISKWGKSQTELSLDLIKDEKYTYDEAITPTFANNDLFEE